MAATPPRHVTHCQDGFHGEQEFVVACKGRPFTILTSSNLPTPAITLVDHKLVTELKLRMSDLQCSKFNYGGKKLRILGKISTSVQCIMGGTVSGNLHIKASVVENLNDHFEAHSIAGTKLSQLLAAPPNCVASDIATNSPEPTTPTTKKKKKKKPTAMSPSSSHTSHSELSPSQFPAGLHPWAYNPPTLHQIRTMSPPPPLSPGFTLLTPPGGRWSPPLSSVTSSTTSSQPRSPASQSPQHRWSNHPPTLHSVNAHAMTAPSSLRTDSSQLPPPPGFTYSRSRHGSHNISRCGYQRVCRCQGCLTHPDDYGDYSYYG